ncbi:TPA: AAA family ATPase [Pseudomonas aeruginosa]
MSLLNYWPTAEEINLCINHEAEGAHDAVLLAVHQPSPLSYRLVSSGKSIEASEDDLFKYLMTKDVPSGSHVVPITGASGVGKSHMVRMLAARLQNVNADSRYVIIRIPKSATLRRVVELILNELPGEDYASVKAEFAKAFTEEINIATAVIRFQGQLDIAWVNWRMNCMLSLKLILVISC